MPGRFWPRAGAAAPTGHTVVCGTVTGQPWSTAGTTGTQWDASAMGAPCATATHSAAVLSAQDAQVLKGPSGYNCYAQVVSATVRPISGSCQRSSDASPNFTWHAAAY